MASAFDVAVIGGGPAGATAGYVLAREGCRAVILERERFPRFHIGESLLPRTMGLYRRLGLIGVLAEEKFIPKYGAQIVSNDGSVEIVFDFFRGGPDPDVVAYEVEREVFDALLLDHARRAGAEVLQGTAVVRARTREDGPCVLDLRDERGGESRLEAKWVVDATGQGSLLAKTHGLRENHPTHRKVAVFTRYRGMIRREGRQSGNVDLVLGDGGWFWLIPLRNDLTSVGFVADSAAWRDSGLDAAAFLEQAIARSPFVAGRLARAERTFEVLTAANYSYSSRRYAGPGFVLVGDAAEFLDPIFSTGVMLAMRSAERAALILSRAIRRGGPLRTSLFDGYQRTFRRWIRTHFRMIEAFYDPGYATVLLNPRNRYGLVDAVTALLAGQSELTFLDRLRVELFYLIIRLNNRWNFLKDPRPAGHAVPHG